MDEDSGFFAWLRRRQATRAYFTIFALTILGMYKGCQAVWLEYVPNKTTTKTFDAKPDKEKVGYSKITFSYVDLRRKSRNGTDTVPTEWVEGKKELNIQFLDDEYHDLARVERSMAWWAYVLPFAILLPIVGFIAWLVGGEDEVKKKPKRR